MRRDAGHALSRSWPTQDHCFFIHMVSLLNRRLSHLPYHRVIHIHCLQFSIGNNPYVVTEIRAARARIYTYVPT